MFNTKGRQGKLVLIAHLKRTRLLNNDNDVINIYILFYLIKKKVVLIYFLLFHKDFVFFCILNKFQMHPHTLE